ncbi:hypothetical protein [Streptomyces sp. NBRC 110465]|uniref:hypothetical protein n=1 Tax=Streptomyces sp. NBRC 110465 TaxID=1897621 RepID=UPI0009341CCC|nr:hypothetical protein [Streptomyces sp. NBRC 110465]
MDIWVALGLIGTLVGIVLAVYYGRRSIKAADQGPMITVKVTNMIPTYEQPDGSSTAGDYFVGATVANTGGRPATITGWGVRLPGNRRMVITRPPHWSTSLPHQLTPGGAPAQLVVPADELRHLERTEGIPYTAMRPYITLADGTEVLGDQSVPLA